MKLLFKAVAIQLEVFKLCYFFLYLLSETFFMKPTIILFFLLLSGSIQAQYNDIISQIKDSKNKKLAEYVDKQELVFNNLESYLTEIGQQEFNASKDSLSASKFTKLLDFYNQISNNAAVYERAPNSKIQFRWKEEYTEARLKRVDSLYSLFTSKRFEEEPEFPVQENSAFIFSPTDTFIEKTPIHESCVGAANDKLCTADYIRKKVANTYEIPELREIAAQKLKTDIQFVINKNGALTYICNAKSCGFFEFDMEFIKLLVTKFSKDKFIPAHQNGKNVNCRYRLPITFMKE